MMHGRITSSRHASSSTCSGARAAVTPLTGRTVSKARALGPKRSSPIRTNALLKKASGVNVSWDQSVDEVNLYVPVGDEVRARDVDLEVHVKRMILKVDGRTVLEGSLADAGEVDAGSSFFTMEGGAEAGGRRLVVTLAKKGMGYNSWEALLESDKPDMTVTDRVFLDIKVGDDAVGKVAIGLFGNVVPKTVANFKALCTGDRGMGEAGKPLSFKGSPFHRIIPEFMAQGGDITEGNGTGGDSIYGPQFEDENFLIKHEEAGFVASANAGPNTNSSQFYILFEPAPHLNGRHVVFGRVLAGMNIVRQLEAIGSPDGTPLRAVTIADCGLLPDDDAVTQVMNDNKMMQLDKST